MAIEAFAKRAGYELVDEFYDAAVSGADPIDTSPEEYILRQSAAALKPLVLSRHTRLRPEP